MDESGNLPIIFIIMGNFGAAILQNVVTPLYPAYATDIYVLSLVFYFAPIPVIVVHGFIAQMSAGKHKIIVGTVWSPKFPDGTQLKQAILQFKFKTYSTEDIPGTDMKITKVPLSEPTEHPYYGAIEEARFVHRGEFIGDNLKLGSGAVEHMGVVVEDHSATDKVVLYESAFVQESKFVRIPVYKIKHAPAFYEQEVEETLGEISELTQTSPVLFA